MEIKWSSLCVVQIRSVCFAKLTLHIAEPVVGCLCGSAGRRAAPCVLGQCDYVPMWIPPPPAQTPPAGRPAVAPPHTVLPPIRSYTHTHTQH